MKLFVGGLPWSVGDGDLQQLFEPYGTVGSAKIITDRESGKSRGFGFVEFQTDSEGEAAIKALNGSSYEGRTLTVKIAEDRPGGGGSGGFRGGNDRRGGGGGYSRGRDRY